MNTIRMSKELSIAKSAMLVEEERTLFFVFVQISDIILSYRCNPN